LLGLTFDGDVVTFLAQLDGPLAGDQRDKDRPDPRPLRQIPGAVCRNRTARRTLPWPKAAYPPNAAQTELIRLGTIHVHQRRPVDLQLEGSFVERALAFQPEGIPCLSPRRSRRLRPCRERTVRAHGRRCGY